MTRRRSLVVVATVTVALVALLGADGAYGAPDLRVRGNALVDGPGRGHPVQLRGINRSGLEYACIQGWGFFDSPHPDRIDDPSMIAAMKSWDINVVRVPLNEDCWLGLHTAPGRGGAPYRRRAWDAVSPGGWSCSGGPSLITSYDGTPTAFGVGLRNHLRTLGSPALP